MLLRAQDHPQHFKVAIRWRLQSQKQYASSLSHSIVLTFAFSSTSKPTFSKHWFCGRLLAPLWPLQSTKNDFIWTAEHDQAFNKARNSLTIAPMPAFFNTSKPTRLCTDASRRGLGFILQQKSEGKWALVQAGSQFLTDTESRYTFIELELRTTCILGNHYMQRVLGWATTLHSRHSSLPARPHPKQPSAWWHRKPKNTMPKILNHCQEFHRSTKLCTRRPIKEPRLWSSTTWDARRTGHEKYPRAVHCRN